MGLFGPNVEKLKENRDVNGLIKLLESKKPDVRRDAADALVRIGGAEILPGLIQALRDADSRVRFYAVVGLAKIKQPAAEEALKMAVSDSDWEVRKEALSALIKSGPTLAVLKQAIEFNSAELRELAAVRLGEMENPETIEILIAVSKDDEELVRLRAINALKKKLNQPNLSPELIARAKDALGGV
jgi:HEAT repeat protein